MSGTTGGPGQITFSTYPDSNRVHGIFVEVDASNANSNSQYQQRGLIIGQWDPTTTNDGAAVTVDEPMLVTDATTAASMFGNGSMLSRMITRWLALNNYTELWALPLADATSAAAATITTTVTGTATAAGTLSLYVGDELLQVGVNLGDTATVVATNIAAAVTAQVDLPVNATASAGVVTWTAKNKGLVGNQIGIGLNLGGALAGQSTPPGISFTGAQLAGGSGTPDLVAPLANLADVTYDFIALPYTDSVSTASMTAFLNGTTGRWSWESMLYGGAFAADVDTLGNLATLGQSLNDPHLSIVGLMGTPTPAYECAADIAAVCAGSLQVDPGVPLQELVTNIMAPPVADRFTISERNTLLYDGISTLQVNNAGQVIIDRMITTYQRNGAGAPDDSWLDVETPYSLMFLIRDMVSYLSTIFARKKLVADGTVIGAGANWVTPKAALAAAVSRYFYQCSIGNAQGAAQFAANATYQKDVRGQVKLLLPFNVDDQLRQLALKIAFLKS